MREFLPATVQHGTRYVARLPIPSDGKAGTSQNYRDAWFTGFARKSGYRRMGRE